MANSRAFFRPTVLGAAGEGTVLVWLNADSDWRFDGIVYSDLAQM
jgi:hypothetical protein